MTDALAQAVEEFAALTFGIPDDVLDRPWAWQSYDSEGIRFAFFRTYEELRELAAQMRLLRAAQGKSETETHHILAQYTAAYWDLKAALLGVSDEIADKAPAEGEWPVRNVLAHMLGAETGFYTVLRWALERERRADGRPAMPPDEARSTFTGLDNDRFRSIVNAPLADTLAWHSAFHTRILSEFADISDAELALPSTYWEDEPMSVRFRLHRFDSHLRQHTIQLDKTLVALGHGPNEAKRLLRLIYSALAEVEGALIPDEKLEESNRNDLARAISARGKEIAGIGA